MTANGKINHQTLKLSSYEKWLDEDYHQWREADGNVVTDDVTARIEAAKQEENFERRTRLNTFPYSVILELSFPEFDFANRWCWQNIGPCDGPCYESSSEYPGCPLVLATGSVESAGGLKERKIHQKVPDHSHTGLWTWYWLGKTEYDFGFCEWYFDSETARETFLAAIPTFNWGEKFPK